MSESMTPHSLLPRVADLFLRGVRHRKRDKVILAGLRVLFRSKDKTQFSKTKRGLQAQIQNLLKQSL